MSFVAKEMIFAMRTVPRGVARVTKKGENEEW